MTLKNMLKRLTSNYLKIENSNIYKIFSLVAMPVEELKCLFDKINSWQGIKNAEGYTLDLIGEDVRQKREGRTDEEYRPILRFKNSLNFSGTDINSVNNSMVNISEGNYISLVEGFSTESKEPACVILNLKEYNQNIDYDKIDEVIAAGVRAYLIVEKDFKKNYYIASALLTGETITVFPYNVGEIESRGKLNIASGYDLSYEVVRINPKN